MSRYVAPPRPEYYVQTGGMHENPYGVPRDEILRMLLEGKPEVVAQTVFGKYVESSGLVFTSEIVQRLFDRKLPRVAGSGWRDEEMVEFARNWRHDDPSSPFHTGVDVARQTDYTVLTTMYTGELPARVVAYHRLNRVPWETIYGEVGKAVTTFGPNVLMDSTGMGGDVVMDALESRQFCPAHRRTVLVGSRCLDPVTQEPLSCKVGEYVPLGCVEGYAFSSTTKKQLVEHLRNCLAVGYDKDNPNAEFGHLRCPPIVQLEEELSFYTWDDKKLETDCLFSLALAAWSGLEDPVGDPSYGSVYGQ